MITSASVKSDGSDVKRPIVICHLGPEGVKVYKPLQGKKGEERNCRIE